VRIEFAPYINVARGYIFVVVVVVAAAEAKILARQ